MKILTTNFVQCAVKSCSRSGKAFPLQYTDVQLIQQEVDFDAGVILNILPRMDWNALIQVAHELGNDSLPPSKPEIDDPESEESQKLLRELHTLLIETQITEGSLVCKNCGHNYVVKSSIPNFLLPPHLS